MQMNFNNFLEFVFTFFNLPAEWSNKDDLWKIDFWIVSLVDFQILNILTNIWHIYSQPLKNFGGKLDTDDPPLLPPPIVYSLDSKQRIWNHWMYFYFRLSNCRTFPSRILLYMFFCTERQSNLLASNTAHMFQLFPPSLDLMCNLWQSFS